MLINATVYQNGKKIKDCNLDEVRSYSKQQKHFTWIALANPTFEEMTLMQDIFDLHPLAVEDSLRGNQRAKLEEYDNTLFTVLQLPEIDGASLHIGNLCIFAANNFLLSIRIHSNITYHHVRLQCEKETEQFKIGPGYILYALMDATVDRYFPLLQWFENELETVEADIFSSNHKTRVNTLRLYNLKQQVASLKNVVAPLIEVAFKLYGGRTHALCKNLEEYFRDVNDHLNKINFDIDNLRETIATAIQVSLSMVAIEDNEITKRLAAWAAIFGIPTILANIWGMNFKYMPELEWKYGYVFAIFLIFGVSIWLYTRFKKHKWI